MRRYGGSVVAPPDPTPGPRLPHGRRVALLTALALAALGLTVGLTTLALRDPPAEPAPPGAPAPSAFPAVQSGVDYGPDRVRLRSALPGLLAGRPVAGAPPAAQLAPLRQPARLAGCLSALLPPERPAVRPLALDYARFAGQPALVVVLPAEDPRQVEVFIVGPACTATEENLLFYAQLPRPGS